MILFCEDQAPPGVKFLGWFHFQETNFEKGLSVIETKQGLLAQGAPLNQPASVQLLLFADVFLRTPFSGEHIQQLKKSCVALFGVGSIGSAIAKSLVRAGVENILLIDPDRLSLTNVFRHECSMLDVGRYKVTALAQSLLQINPQLSLKTMAENIFQWPSAQLENLLENVSVVIDSTDRPSARLTTASLGYELHKPVVHAGCFEEGRGGEVFWHIPDVKEPCYWCLREGMAQPPKSRTIDYSTAQGPDDFKGEPGLDAVTKSIAMAAVQISLALLLRGMPDCQLSLVLTTQSNYLLLGNAFSNNFYRFKGPFHTFFQPFNGPRKSCSLCQKTTH
ncbi:Sulfur carrier protein ThiS adenylyltransferase [Gimesia alba]|uniref:Sulfur carrier protein ThiS adenylyltransferase n=2 Tax=Gimesia alba TaxID=2527973 RepID=A0A517RFC8_9PLAN|nr:Sulfur carrier protein ThiS adenylyltransferase [Gimesia alba]